MVDSVTMFRNKHGDLFDTTAEAREDEARVDLRNVLKRHMSEANAASLFNVMLRNLDEMIDAMQLLQARKKDRERHG